MEQLDVSDVEELHRVADEIQTRIGLVVQQRLDLFYGENLIFVQKFNDGLDSFEQLGVSLNEDIVEVVGSDEIKDDEFVFFFYSLIQVLNRQYLLVQNIARNQLQQQF